MSKPNCKTATAQKWQALIKQFDASGTRHATQWCRENNVSYDSFIFWRRHLKGAANKEAAVNASFVELINTPSSQVSGIELHYRGFLFVLNNDFDEKAFLRCLQALGKI